MKNWFLRRFYPLSVEKEYLFTDVVNGQKVFQFTNALGEEVKAHNRWAFFRV